MRRIKRLVLDDAVQADLVNRQTAIDRKRAAGGVDCGSEWKAARRTASLAAVLATLKRMVGLRERCMYCVDSHSTDIEHFWPKSPYPERMFLWVNLLLCCTECGRFKGDRFPLAGEAPLLVDPTAEDPWLYLDFDPITGNVVPCFDVGAADWAPKGVTTVEVLQLDRREAMAAGYRRTYLLLTDIVERRLAGTLGAELSSTLQAADDHGLLTWCLFGHGKDLDPFSTLRKGLPREWTSCLAAMQE